jgi:hypothetical protein
MLVGSTPPQSETVQHGGALPELQSKKVNLYSADLARGQAFNALSDLLRASFEIRLNARSLAAQYGDFTD